MKKSHFILLAVILFPSLLYFLFELSQANFRKMPHYGPKTVNEKGDTVYYSVPDMNFSNSMRVIEKTDKDESGNEVTVRILQHDTFFTIDTTKYPIYLILFLNDSLKSDGYKLKGIYDYVQYKPTEFKDIHMFFVSGLSSLKEDTSLSKQYGTFDSLKITLQNIYPLIDLSWQNKGIAKDNYFKQKPYYVFDYFAVLVDKQRHIRGYYDPNQNSEIKRMLEDFKHLKIRDGYAETLQKNELEKK